MEERYVLAKFVKEIIRRSNLYEEEKGYKYSWHVNEICQIIEEIRAASVLGEDIEFVEEEVE